MREFGFSGFGFFGVWDFRGLKKDFQERILGKNEWLRMKLSGGKSSLAHNFNCADQTNKLVFTAKQHNEIK